MTKSLMAGMTDYRHQTFDDVINDLKSERASLKDFLDHIEENVNILVNQHSQYWNSSVPYNIKQIISYSKKFYSTAIIELDDIIAKIIVNVEENHIQRLNNIYKTSSEINTEIGNVWNNDYPNKPYGSPDFIILETIYKDTRDMAVNLLDISNMVTRLSMFIGRSTVQQNKSTNSPWNSGLYYLLLLIVIVVLLILMANYTSWYYIPVLLVATVTIVGVIGALQLKNDGQISDATFSSLMIETYKRLPLIRNIFKD